MDLNITRISSGKPVFALLAVLCAGCVPQSAYLAHQAGGDNFYVNDKYLMVEPLDYPVFAMKQDHAGPRSNVNPESGFVGGFKPDLLSRYRWQVTHAFDGKFLIYSVEYDQQSCLVNASVRYGRSEDLIQRICNPQLSPTFFSGLQGAGADYRYHIYLKPDGTAYGWQYLKNPKRLMLESDKVSWFRVDATGDWSGQPWFECVARCDKLVNMQAETKASAAQ